MQSKYSEHQELQNVDFLVQYMTLFIGQRAISIVKNKSYTKWMFNIVLLWIFLAIIDSEKICRIQTMIPVLSIPEVKKLIIADDDWDDQILLKEVIDNHEFAPNVVTVSDGNQLISAIQSGPAPDLILLDLNMPNKNGIECLIEIRASAVYSSLPIVVLSTSKDLKDIELCYANGAQLFFSKPYTFESLKGLINFIISIHWKNFPKKLDKVDFLRIAQKEWLSAIQ